MSTNQKPSKTPETDAEFDVLLLLKQAEGRARNNPLYKRFIEGTPLSNDIAVWMLDFVLRKADFVRQLERERDEAREALKELLPLLTTTHNIAWCIKTFGEPCMTHQILAKHEKSKEVNEHTN